MAIGLADPAHSSETQLGPIKSKCVDWYTRLPRLLGSNSRDPKLDFLTEAPRPNPNAQITEEWIKAQTKLANGYEGRRIMGFAVNDYSVGYNDANRFTEIPEMGRYFSAHGMTRGSLEDQLRSLISILKNGIDKDKPFHSGPLFTADNTLSAGIGAGGGSFRGGGFQLLARPEVVLGRHAGQEGPAIVLVNTPFYEAIPKLTEQFPKIRFVRVDRSEIELPQILRQSLVKPANIDEIEKTVLTRAHRGFEDEIANAEEDIRSFDANRNENPNGRKWRTDAVKRLRGLQDRMREVEERLGQLR